MDSAEKAYTLLKDLIRVDTSNPPGNETAAAELVARFLKDAGVESRLIEKEPGRGNLVARVDPSDQAQGEGGAVLVSAHLDTVPADAADWKHAPWSGAEVDGFLWGRGAIDVKNGVAMHAALLAEAKRRGGLKRPLVFAAVADEEAGCALGSRYLAEAHPDLVRSEYFLGEGGGMTQWAMGRKIFPIGAAEKGQMYVRLSFLGEGGHASIPNPDDAAFLLGRFLDRLGGGLPIHLTAPAQRFLSDLGDCVGGARGAAVGLLRWPPAARALAGRLPAPTGQAIRAMLSNTASPTRVSASGAPNAIPREIVCELDVRTLPGMSSDTVLNELRALAGAGARISVLHESPAVVSSPDTPLFRHLCERVRAHVPDAAPVPILIPGYTDAKWFSRNSKHCYGFLPVLNDDPAEAGRFRTLMHGVDERISKDAFLKGYRLLEDAVLSFCS